MMCVSIVLQGKMSKPVIFVIGATGHVGTATVAALSAKFAEKVEIRAGVRNPEKAEKLNALPNVTVVQATMGESNLVGVLTGVTTLYIVTPGSENRAQLTSKTAEYAKQAGVKHIAVVSVPTAGLTDTVFGRQCSEIENNVSKFGIPYTIIRLPIFMENYFQFKNSILGQGIIFSPVDPDKVFQPVSVEDIGKASAAILVNSDKYVNKIITIVSDSQTYGGFTRALSEVLGKEIKYVRVPYEAAKKGFTDLGVPEWQADGILEILKLIDSASPLVTKNDIGLYKTITGEEPTDLKKWLAKNSAAFQ